MKTIFSAIDQEKIKLEKHELIEWMSTTHQPLAFVPSMTFFVLGFRDILSYLKRPNPKDIWDHSINVHCEEDAHHWLWYIEDLQKIGVRETTWGKDFSKLLLTTWSSEGHASRDMVYEVIHFAKSTNDPFIHLALIESLEAAFAVFINALMPQIEKRGWQNDLRYFGSRHHEDESGHALGSWVGDVSIDQTLKSIELNESQKDLALKFVSETFLKFNSLFTSWYNQRNIFEKELTPLKKEIEQFETRGAEFLGSDSTV